MILDWQSVAVILLLLAAACYVGRRGWLRLRSFALRKGEDSTDALATSCGGCAGDKKSKTAPSLKVLVQINRPRPNSRRTN